MASEEKSSRKRRNSEVRHSVHFGSICKMRAEYHKCATGTKMRRVKGETEPVEETIYETFWTQSPVGLHVAPLKNKLTAAFQRVLSGGKTKVELPLERFPQVNTVVGQILAGIPKAQRKKLTCGYTTDEEENLLFFIERTR